MNQHSPEFFQETGKRGVASLKALSGGEKHRPKAGVR